MYLNKNVENAEVQNKWQYIYKSAADTTNK